MMMLKTVLIFLFLGRCVLAQILPQGYPCEIFGSTLPSNTSRCPTRPLCQEAESEKYRRASGECNNLKVDTLWGSAGAPLARLAMRKRLSVFGYPPRFRPRGSNRYLSDARKISSHIHAGRDSASVKVSELAVIFGQFLDHDITLSPEMNLCSHTCPSVEEIDCCEFIGRKQTPKSCLPILIPENDQFHNAHKNKLRCLDFKRSQPFPCNYTHLRPHKREQFNILTSFTDASNVYGSTLEKQRAVRLFEDGLLKTSKGNLLPFEEDVAHVCERSSMEPPKTFLAGDVRANENPALQSLHTLWMKEHNRLAAIIKENSNDSLSDEDIFQEARRFLIAEWQQIIYAEWLPIILGPKLIKQYDLDLDSEKLYNPELSPNIFNGFSTAAFRFGHSLVASKISMMSDNNTMREVRLSNTFFDTNIMLEGGFSELMRGLCNQRAEKRNSIINDELRNFLFLSEAHPFGSDLAARNIQRGRDHELASYDGFRKALGLSPLPGSFFSHPPAELKREQWTKLSRIYHSPSDIELFPAGMCEENVEGGLVGQTFGRIIAEQFRRLRFGDRYFFTHKSVNRNIRFCDEDLEAIRNRTMFDVICDNMSNEMSRAPLSPFLASSDMATCEERSLLEPTPLCQADKNNHDDFVEAKNMPLMSGGEESVVVMAGGYNGWKVLDSVEVYSPTGRCSHFIAPLPRPTYGLFLAYLETKDNKTLIACGGNRIGSNKEAGSRCWAYDRAQKGIGRWVDVPSLAMNEPRWYSASSQLGTGGIFVSGGRYSSLTTEYLDPTTSRWRRTTNLPTPRILHCQTPFGNDSIILMGGTTSIYRVDQFNGTTGQFQQKKFLFSFRNKYSCILLPDGNTVLLIGSSNRMTSIYHVSTARPYIWSDTILSHNYGKVLNLNGRIFVIGGDSHVNRVEEYDARRKKFKLVEARTLEVRSRFGAIAVPAKLFRHLPGGCGN